MCPDTKRMKKNPDKKEEKVLVLYRLSSIISLHDKFVSESLHKCGLEYFRQNCPYDKPNPNDWGTCLNVLYV